MSKLKASQDHMLPPEKSDVVSADEPALDTRDIVEDLQDKTKTEFSRVSPLAILYFFARSMYFLVFNVLIYSLPAFAAMYSKLRENIWLIGVGVSAIVLIVLFSSVLKYLFYYYRFTDERVEIKQGVFSKSHLDLPFNKIQNVKIVQPFYYRFNNYSFIELDTAGSSQQEAKIIALPIKLAERFKTLVLSMKQNGSNRNGKHSIGENDNDISAGDERRDQEIVLNTRNIRDLIIHGISNNRVWIFLGALAPFYNAITENINSILRSIGLDLVSYLDYQSQSLGLFVLHILSIVMFIMLLIVCFSVLGSIFVFYGYRLSRSEDRLIRRSGLLSKHEVSMKLSRVQIAIQQQDWLDILLRRVNLQFEQNSSLPNIGQNNVNQASKLIVPSVTKDESTLLIKESFDVNSFYDIQFKPISPRLIVRSFLFYILPVTALFTAIGMANSWPAGAWLVLLLAFALMMSMAWLRWKRWGYYLDKDYVYLRKGFLGVNYYVFPISKTQQVEFIQSRFMRKRGLAHLRYVLASGAQTIPFISEKEASSNAEYALYFVRYFKPAWM